MSGRPKIVHVVVAGEIGGAERLLVELASRPESTGAEHAIALLTPNRALARLLVQAGLRVFDRGPVRENPVAFLWRSLGSSDVAWIASVATTCRADIVHLHTFGSQVVGTRAARRVGARVLRTEHSTRVYDDPTCWPFSRWSLERADAAVAISAHVERVALAKAPWARGKLRVVRNGVDTDRFSPRAKARPSGAPFTFVLVGRLEPRKGIDVAIDALTDVPNAHLVIVGDGQERARLEERVRARGLSSRVRFEGYLEDPRDVVSASDALLCSSREEGLGIALLEGMAMGRPVVAVPVGGVPEIVAHEVTGLLASRNDAAALARVMRDAMNAGPRLRDWGAAARSFVVERASMAAMCRGYREIYERLAEPGPSRASTPL